MKFENKHLTYKILYEKSFDRNPLFTFNKFECYMSLFITIVFFIIMHFVYSSNDAEKLTSILQSVILNVGIALLGMLGFIVGGLAIISGTIGNKIAHAINKEGKFDKLLSILFSFYYIGFVVAILIVLFFFSYFLVSIHYSFNYYLYAIISVVLCYLFFFSIFFCVSLLGTCINMFVINFNYSEDKEDENYEDNLNKHYDDCRLNSLMYVMIRKNLLTKDEYIEVFKTCIDECPEHMKEGLTCKMCNDYSINK